MKANHRSVLKNIYDLLKGPIGRYENSIIKKFSQITAGSVVCGRAQIGKGCWLAPNSVISDGCKIGDNCFVGASSFVKTDFPKNSVLAGSPAKFLRKTTFYLAKILKMITYKKKLLIKFLI